MGSVSMFFRLPARLAHPGHIALVGLLAQADPAQAELAVVGAGPTALAAAVIPAGLVLRGALLRNLLGRLRHSVTPRSSRRLKSLRRPRQPRRPRRPPRLPRPPRASPAWRRPRGSPP